MRFSLMAGALCVALMTGTGAFAQVPPNPNNPNDTVPDAMVQPPYGEPVNTETAKKVAAAAIAESKKRNWNGLCVAVVGPPSDLAAGPEISWFPTDRDTARLSFEDDSGNLAHVAYVEAEESLTAAQERLRASHPGPLVAPEDLAALLHDWRVS